MVDLSKTTMGILFSVALPTLLKTLVEAGVKDGLPEAENTKKPRKQSTLHEFYEAFTRGLY